MNPSPQPTIRRGKVADLAAVLTLLQGAGRGIMLQFAFGSLPVKS